MEVDEKSTSFFVATTAAKQTDFMSEGFMSECFMSEEEILNSIIIYCNTIKYY